MYDSITQPGLQTAKPKYNFLDQLDKQGRIKFDPNGSLIPKNYRMSWKDFIANPYGKYTAGNAINPIAPATPNFLQAYGGGVANAANPITSILGGGFR